MDQKKLNEILKKHALWLWNEPDGIRADLCGVDLCGVDLCGADLCGVDLCGANLCGVDLCGANLCEANLCRADLCRADLYEANLRGANLCRANLCEANLCGANLCRANLCRANLCEANLCGADLCRADLCGADLCGADLCGADLCRADLCRAENVPYIPMACPDTGEFIAWKKAYDKEDNPYLIKLFIPEDARRSSATGRKCRADKAVVLSIEPIVAEPVVPEVVYSKYDKSFTYKIGQAIVVPDFDTDRFNACAPGVHFFICKQEAIDYHF